jgi:hypothetical protein
MDVPQLMANDGIQFIGLQRLQQRITDHHSRILGAGADGIGIGFAHHAYFGGR